MCLLRCSITFLIEKNPSSTHAPEIVPRLFYSPLCLAKNKFVPSGKISVKGNIYNHTGASHRALTVCIPVDCCPPHTIRGHYQKQPDLQNNYRAAPNAC